MKTLPFPLAVLLVSALVVTSVPFVALARTNDDSLNDRTSRSTIDERREQYTEAQVTPLESLSETLSSQPTSIPIVENAPAVASSKSKDLGFAVSSALGGRRAEHPAFRSDEVIVKFKTSRRPIRIATNRRDVRDVILEYSARSDVEYAEPNYIAYAFGAPNDPYYSPYQWNFDNPITGGVHAETAWDSTTGSGVVVAIVDTGVAYEDYSRGWFEQYSLAPDLAGTSFVEGYDFVNNDKHANDDNGHGTHIAGTIAGTTNNDQGVAGLAYGATIMPVKVLASSGAGSYADVADGIRFAADNGADVINLSLGGPSSASYLEDAVCYAKALGVTVVAASGNDGASSVSYPAAYDNCVIAVGATRYDETRAGYSNKGTSLDLVAPGGDTGVDQNGDGYGDGILQMTFGSNPNSFGYYFYQGTSMATPHVAAAAALVIANGNATTPESVQSLLESTADDLGPSGRDNTYGHGLINLAAALEDSVTPPPPVPDPEPEPDPEPTPNVAPTADAGADQEADDGDNSGAESVTLDGTGSSDSDGTIVSYEWYEDGAYLGSGGTLTTEFGVGVHAVDLLVIDDEGATSTDQVLITVHEYVAPPTPPVNTELLSEGFETDAAGWTQDRQNDWKLSAENSYEGSYAAEVDGRTRDSILVSPSVTLPSAADVTVSFAWLIERGLDSGEYLAFDVSTDGGNSWTEHRRLQGNVDSEDEWYTETVDLGTQENVQVRFRANMSGPTEDAYVDSVLIETN